MEMNLNYETQGNYEDSLEDFNSQLLDLYQEIRWNENNIENIPFVERKEADEYNKYPYINEQDYKKYFAPETFNFKQSGVWSCRFVSSIYWITRMESYKSLIKNSVKKDTSGDFIIKLPLSKEKGSGWTWHKINLSVYQNQRTIDGSNPQILHKENKDENQDTWNWIVALAMAIWEELTRRTNFDIYRLEGWNPIEVFLDWKTIKGISLEGVVNKSDIDINKLREILWQNDTIVTASVKVNNNDWSFETLSGNNGDKSNHEIAITQIIKEWNDEYIEYYDPNFSELKKISVDDFLGKCSEYTIFCETDAKKNYHILDRKKSYQDKENDNSAWIVVEKTWKSNETLRNLRWDFITYEEDGKIIVESFGKRSEIINGMPQIWYTMIASTLDWEIIRQDSWELIDVADSTTQKLNPYRSINFPYSNVRLYINTNSLKEKYKWEKNEKYKVNLYLPKIANFMNRIIHDYIDTEAWDKGNPSPFSINKTWDLVFDDDPYNVSLDKVEDSERINMEVEWRERRKEKEKPWNHKLVCLRHRKELWIDDKDTKNDIVNTLNNMVHEKINNK